MGDITGGNALRNFLRPSPMPNRDYGLSTAGDDGTLLPDGQRRPRPIGGTMMQMPNSGSNALANVMPQGNDGQQPSNALNPGSILTPFGWLPPDLASRLGGYFGREASGWLGAPVDAAAWGLKRLGVNVPGGFVDGVSADGSPQHWAPSPSVPLSSEFFNNLLGDAGNLSAEAWRRLRR
jgi:hypothetical protein